MGYLFTSESVSEGHPDKVADQISDAVLDKLLAYDPCSKVACETLVTTGQVVLAGEVNTKAYIDLQRVAREVINRIGYTKSEYMFEGNSCGVLSAIHEQSPDINRGVEREDPMNQGAGDQGMMFGYATNETENYMPLSLDLAHKLLIVLAKIRREGKEMTYLRPDAKSQVTVEYDDNRRPARIDTIVISTQHDEFILPENGTQEAQEKADKAMLEQIHHDVVHILMPRVTAEIHNPEVLKLFNNGIKYHVNPTGKFVIGGPHGDTGLTGRKIIVDTYGGKGAHGGGAFSGKDPSKVDRSAAYAARHIAKNMVAAGVADEMLVQVSYAIGLAEPINIYVDTYGTSHVAMNDGEIADAIRRMFDLRPKAIEERLKLRNPIYEETAAYGQFYFHILVAFVERSEDCNETLRIALRRQQGCGSRTLHMGEIRLCGCHQKRVSSAMTNLEILPAKRRRQGIHPFFERINRRKRKDGASRWEAPSCSLLFQLKAQHHSIIAPCKVANKRCVGVDFRGQIGHSLQAGQQFVGLKQDAHRVPCHHHMRSHRQAQARFHRNGLRLCIESISAFRRHAFHC